MLAVLWVGAFATQLTALPLPSTCWASTLRRKPPPHRSRLKIIEAVFLVLWHLCNLFIAPWAVAALLTLLIKLIWRRDCRALAWRRLLLWGGAGGCVAVLAALALLERDGTMFGYGLLLLGISLPQWWLMQRQAKRPG